MLRLIFLRIYRYWVRYDLAIARKQAGHIHQSIADYTLLEAHLNGEIARAEISIGRMPTC